MCVCVDVVEGLEGCVQGGGMRRGGCKEEVDALDACIDGHRGDGDE